MYRLARLNRVVAYNFKYTPFLHINKHISTTSKRFNSDNGIPWFVQKYEEEEPSSNPLSLDGALKNLEDRENLTIKYSDEIIFEKDPPENIEDIEKLKELNDFILKQFENLKVITNFKDLTIVNSPLRTNKDYFILLNSMDSKQHNDRILGTLKGHFKKLSNPDMKVENIKVSGFRQDYLSKRKRFKISQKLKINNGFINSRYFKKNREENLTNEQIQSLFNKGTDKSWGMLSFDLVCKDQNRYTFEIHVLSPLQRTLINFEELYQIEGIHQSLKDMLMLLEKDNDFYQERNTKFVSFDQAEDEFGDKREKEGSIFEELEEENQENVFDNSETKKTKKEVGY